MFNENNLVLQAKMTNSYSRTEYNGVLSYEKVKQFHKDGYLGPLKACSPDEAAEFAESVEVEILNGDGYPLDHTDKSIRHDRHRDSQLVYDFLSQPSIVNRIQSLYGPDLLLWTSHFWEKEPGESGVPWHQEQHFSAVEPPVTATIDLALDPVDETSGCMEVIPGSHEQFVPHGEAAGAESQGLADSEYVDQSCARSIPLKAGEFVLYNSRLLHRTLANGTDRERRSVSCRMTPPIINIQHESPLMYDDHASIVVSGEDRYGINRTVEPPSSEVKE
ncbi:phytanoyl-CoA dioxygenase family protein [Haloarchaeobius amylolyticus]|uniref:Phytanoyl-CoA dioxygenase family protein n=1 Tax=Haloarchaeobius amylolyticus TaxID=1198296 RepID=A0ABD6BIP0_9EURY